VNISHGSTDSGDPIFSGGFTVISIAEICTELLSTVESDPDLIKFFNPSTGIRE